MDRPDEMAPDVERRASTRLSRTAPTRADATLNNAADNDAYLAAMAMTVSDGFRPYSVAGTNQPLPSPRPIGLGHDQRPPPTSSAPHGDADDAMPATARTAPGAPSASARISVPAQSSSEAASSASPPSQPSAALAASPSPQPRSTIVPRPSSIVKPPIGSLPIGTPTSSDSAATTAASSSSSSNSSSSSRRHPTADVRPNIQEEEPYQGPSGPSFPYQMYPQNVRMARTRSGSTTSTAAQSQSSYTGPHQPTFPYALYPQNTTMVGPSTVVAGIPVGFPGMADNYQRRIGPDGEDAADLIGPDGHTEQLPPYTRYPDEAYTRKIAAAGGPPHPDPLAGPMVAPNSVPVAPAAEGVSALPAVSVVSAVSAVPPGPAVPVVPAISAAPAVPAVSAVPAAAQSVAATAALSPAIHPIPGAGGIGLASHNPEFDGAEDAGLPRSRYSLRSFNSDGSGPEINTAARIVSEKRKQANFIQRHGGRRILGIVPYWAICLVATALVLMGIILGSVIGVFVAKHRKSQGYHSKPNPMSVTVTVDATPIPTPSNLAPLPTGTFSLPLQKDEGPGACFNDTTQAQAWSCSIPFQYGMTVVVDSVAPTIDGPMYNISINFNRSATVDNDVFFYGEQAPAITTPMPLQLVNDTLDPNRGPAWFKMLPYNKTVVVYETFLSVPGLPAPTGSANYKRGSDDIGGLSFGAAGPFHRKGVAPAQVGDKPWVCTWPDTILEVFIYPNQNTSMYKISLSSAYTSATPTPTSTPDLYYSATGLPAHAAAYAGTGTTATTGTGASPTSPPQYPSLPPMLPPYPRVVKVEERRMANSPQATCVQYELIAAGDGLKAVPNRDLDGKIVEITIAEIETGPSLFAQSELGVLDEDQSVEKRDVSGLSKCGCLWMVV